MVDQGTAPPQAAQWVIRTVLLEALPDEEDTMIGNQPTPSPTLAKSGLARTA